MHGKERRKNQRRGDVLLSLAEVRKNLRVGVVFVGKAGLVFSQWPGRHGSEEHFLKRKNEPDAWPWYQFILKPKRGPSFNLGPHWNEGQLQKDLTLYFAHFLALGCRATRIETGSLRSTYSRSRLNKRVLTGKQHGSIILCLRSVSAPVVTCSFLMPLELLNLTFTHLKLRFLSFPKERNFFKLSFFPWTTNGSCPSFMLLFSWLHALSSPHASVLNWYVFPFLLHSSFFLVLLFPHLP